MKTPMSAPAAPTALSLHDARPFFEKALAHGVQHGVIDTTTLDAIQEQAPRGMVQIARYFGSEFLRPELEKARERMVNLVSLYLQESCDNDLHCGWPRSTAWRPNTWKRPAPTPKPSSAPLCCGAPWRLGPATGRMPCPSRRH